MNKSEILTRIVLCILLAMCAIHMDGCGWVRCNCLFGLVPCQEEEQPQPMVAPLRLTEVLPYPVEGESAWIELYNELDTIVNPGGQRIVVERAADIVLDSMHIPAKSYVVIQLGDSAAGLEAAALPISQFRVVYAGGEYAGAMGRMPCFISTLMPSDKGDTIVDYLAWGAQPSLDSLRRAGAESKIEESFVEMVPGAGDYDPDYTVARGFSIGAYSVAYAMSADDWAVYRFRDDISPGAANTVPRPDGFDTPNGARFALGHVLITWAQQGPNVRFEFQLAADSSFQDLIASAMLDEAHYTADSSLAAGYYSYRVRTIAYDGTKSDWCPTRYFQVSPPRSQIQFDMESTVDGAPSDSAIEFVTVKSIVRKSQAKDTRLLCLDGCTDMAGSLYPWDDAHPEDVEKGAHGHRNCVRACISMVVSAYGKSLSQDRIAYWDQEVAPWARGSRLRNKPEGDLAHNTGMAFGHGTGQETRTLSWALGDPEDLIFRAKNPTYDELKTWLKEKRPIMFRVPWHMRVVFGCETTISKLTGDTTEWVHMYDPDPRRQVVWWRYEQWDSLARGTWICPVYAPKAKEDETGVHHDSDGDGLMDFDETHRFGTNPSNPDTDGDGIADKTEISAYAFRRCGHCQCVSRAAIYTRCNICRCDPNLDSDSVRMERDWDSDGDGCSDGEEDSNSNGRTDPGETSNFEKNLVGACHKTASSQDTHNKEDPDSHSSRPSVDRLQLVFVLDRSGSSLVPSLMDTAKHVLEIALNTLLDFADSGSVDAGLVFVCDEPYFDTRDSLTNTALERLDRNKCNKILASVMDPENEPDTLGETATGDAFLVSLGPDGFSAGAGSTGETPRRVMVILSDGEDNFNCGASSGSRPVKGIMKSAKVMGRVLIVWPPKSSTDSSRLCAWARFFEDPHWSDTLECDQELFQRNTVAGKGESVVRAWFREITDWRPGPDGPLHVQGVAKSAKEQNPSTDGG